MKALTFSSEMYSLWLTKSYFILRIVLGDYVLGALIVNGYVKSDKFLKFYNFIIKSFNDENITLEIIKNNSNPICVEKNFFTKKYDFVLFFDKDVTLARYLEKSGYRVFNSSMAINVCDDKALTNIELSANSKIKTPKTLINPFSYDKNYLEYEDIIKEFKVPFILKERKGSFGEQVYLVYSADDYHKIIKDSSSNIIIQEYIDYHYHEDYRVYVVGHKVICAYKRIGKENDFRANVTLGGHMELCNIDKSMIEMAEEVSKTLHLDFAGLDFVLDKNNKPLFLEANSNAHFLNAYNVSGINIAKFIAKYIKKEINVL